MKKQNLKAICDQMFADYPDIVTVKQVQKMLRCSRTFVYNLIYDGDLPALQIGVGYKIPTLCVSQYILSREKDSEPNPDKETWRKRNPYCGEKKGRK